MTEGNVRKRTVNKIQFYDERNNNNHNHTNNQTTKTTNGYTNIHTSSTKKKNKLNILITLFYFILIIIVVVISGVVYMLVTRLGIGNKDIDNSKYENMKAIYSNDVLEIVCELDIPAGNIAVGRDYRTFFNYHPEYHPNPIKIVEMINYNSTSNTYDLIPYPSLEFQSNYITVLSLRIDTNNILWLLDFAQHGLLGTPTLYGFQLVDSYDRGIKNDVLKYNYSFPSNIAGIGSFLNDFQIDPSGDYIYIADTSIIGASPALIIFAVKTLKSYRLLSKHPSMFGDSVFWNISGITIPPAGPFGMKINVDSIALDRDGSTLYYGAVTGNKLYAVSTSHLLALIANSDLRTEYTETLEKGLPFTIQEVLLYDDDDNLIDKPSTDGLTTDNAGNIYLTSFEQSSISIAIPMKSTELGKFSMRLKKVVQSKELLRWPDGFSFGPDGLYITNSALHLKMANLLGGPKHMEQFRPFHILRLSLDSLERFSKELDDGTILKFAQSGQ